MHAYTFIFKILLGLLILKSFKISLFQDLVGKIIEAKVAEYDFFAFFRYFELNYIQDEIFKNVFLDNSDRKNRIVQINKLFVLYRVIVI